MSLVGHIRGGLGYVAIIAAFIFAGLSGSVVQAIRQHCARSCGPHDGLNRVFEITVSRIDWFQWYCGHDSAAKYCVHRFRRHWWRVDCQALYGRDFSGHYA